MALTVAQLTGRDDSHITYADSGVGLTAETWQAFTTLRKAGAEQGFDLRIASGFRSFVRQLSIWNGKAGGTRPVHDDQGEPVAILDLPDAGKIHAILRYSALPGASRHHWGSDLDVYDAAAMPRDYHLQLVPGEVTEAGIFGPLHAWLDAQIDEGSAAQFYRPYAADRGGVAAERWHLSYRPLACKCMPMLTPAVVEAELAKANIALAEVLQEQLPEIFQRYINE
jgi:LAS superfamily LD-carboxypeptidase LdcB